LTDIILYSNGCSKCVVLEKILERKKLNFVKVSDKEIIMKRAEEHGFYSLPFMQIDKEFYDFNKALTKLK